MKVSEPILDLYVYILKQKLTVLKAGPCTCETCKAYKKKYKNKTNVYGIDLGYAHSGKFKRRIVLKPMSK